jgi:hypothetical protein
MSSAWQIAPGPMYRPTPPQKDRDYLRFVRGHQCAVCGAYRPIEAAHSAIPLCIRDHRTGPDSLHALGPVKFEERHNLNIAERRAELNAEYDALPRRKGVQRCES